MTIDELVCIERDSIQAFVEHQAHVFDGRAVLDYGCGFQPYRALVEAAGGRYNGWNDASLPGSKAPATGLAKLLEPQRYGVILCTQVIEYVPEPAAMLETLRGLLNRRGHLVITGPTNWPEVDSHDKWRLTRSGIKALLQDAGFKVLVCEHRAMIDLDGFRLAVGWGALARTT